VSPVPVEGFVAGFDVSVEGFVAGLFAPVSVAGLFSEEDAEEPVSDSAVQLSSPLALPSSGFTAGWPAPAVGSGLGVGSMTIASDEDESVLSEEAEEPAEAEPAEEELSAGAFLAHAARLRHSARARSRESSFFMLENSFLFVFTPQDEKNGRGLQNAAIFFEIFFKGRTPENPTAQRAFRALPVSCSISNS
jgi:hypothetical protein